VFNLKLATLYGKLWRRTNARKPTIAEIRLERMRESWLRTLAYRRHHTSLRYRDQGGLTHMPEVSNFTSSAQLTCPLAMGNQGNVNEVFVFQIRSTLVTTSNSLVAFLKGATGGRAYWQIGSPATLCIDTPHADNDVALTSITLDTSASVQFGRATVRNGSKTPHSNESNTNFASLAAGNSGTKRNEFNGNGNQEATETWMDGVAVFHDLANDGRSNDASAPEEVNIEETQVVGYTLSNIDLNRADN
jgi:ice-binding like protein